MTSFPVRAPRAAGSLLLGCLGEFKRDPIGLLTRVTQQHGDIVRLRFGPIIAHVVNRPVHIGQVLEERQDNYDKRTRSVSKIRATCGASLLTAGGPLWLRHRRLIQPALSSHVVQRYIPIVRSAAQVMLDQWEELARVGQKLDVVAEMMKLTMVIAARVLFGSDIRNDTLTIERSLGEILTDTWRRVESIYDLASVSPVFHRHRFVRAVRQIDSVVYRIIEERRHKPGMSEDLLAALLEANDVTTGNGFTDRELRDATITMLLSGHETTANALATAFAMIFQLPAVEEQLVHELREVLGDRSPDPCDLDRLDYVNRTFAETIRLYPSIWIIERRVVANDEIGGYAIPARSMLLISPYVTHRHPEYWEDAERFDPDRFTPAAAAGRPKHAYIPFGAGPHQCIGRFLAPMIAQLILAMVVQRFKLVPVNPGPIAMLPGITLRHAGPIWMTPVQRKDAAKLP